MTEDKKEKFPSTFTVDNFSSTVELAKNEHKIGFEAVTEKIYDPYEHRQPELANTYSGALMHMLKSSLGTGILAIPHAIAAAGLILGAVGTVVVGIVCTHTIHLLVFASQQMCKKSKKPALGFGETAQHVFQHGPNKVRPFAKTARIFVDTALVLTYYAGNAVYVVFIAENIQTLTESELDVRYFMLFTLVPLAICCQIRELKHLVPFSVIANITMVVAFGITLYDMFSKVGDVNISERKMFNDITEFPKFFSTVLFAMEGIGTMLPIENSMLRSQFLGYRGVLTIGMSSVTTIYTIMGVFGYLTFGDKVSSNIIAELDHGIPAQVARGCISTAVFFTFMLQFSVPCGITWRMLKPKVPKSSQNVAQVALRSALIVCIVGVAVVVPKLNAIIGLVGSVFFSILGLFIPVVIDIVLNSSENGDFGFMKWKLWKNILIAIISWFALISGSYYAIIDLIG